MQEENRAVLPAATQFAGGMTAAAQTATALTATAQTATAQTATAQTASAQTAIAQNGSVITTPQLTDIRAARDANITISVHNTYGQHPDGTPETECVSPTTAANIQKCQADLKHFLENETKNLSQGTNDDVSSTPLNKIYTELYITEGGSGEVNNEHEVIELECRRSTCEGRKIQLEDLFRPLSKEENPPRRVLTKGIAGIGKTVAVRKFTHDWATGKANRDTQFIFPLSFRELNLLKDETLSLIQLINRNFVEVEGLKPLDYNSVSLMFIFDGLDESKFPLDFKKNKRCRSVTQCTTVDSLLTNLIEGKLLHNASIWITSRPAAAAKIPSQHFNRVTEVRGFNDEQKEEYFQKKISDSKVAQNIFEHLQSKPLRSLYIMCHIPVFCWISATALESLVGETPTGELPKTVTEMYTHFLIVQTTQKHEKDYQGGEKDPDIIMKLGKLAFEQLQKGNIIFHEKDLKDCQIDLSEAAVYSGVCTQIIRKEHGLHKQVIYSFIHLSVQEFLAALYVQETFKNTGKNLIPSRVTVTMRPSVNERLPIVFLHKKAVDLALSSDYGLWDLFLRFLLGLSQDKNQELLQKIFGSTERLPQSNQATITYIHEKIRKLSYTDKSINLFHCLNELGDQSLVEQVQMFQRSGDISKILPTHWSALAFVLLVSNEELDVFDLKKHHRSDEVLERLVPVLKVAKKALLSDCNLTGRCSKCVSTVLSLKSSGLLELDLSRNDLKDSGVKLLSDGLKSPNCKLQSLRLKECSVSIEGCCFLASGLASNPHLKELDLSKNELHDVGLEHLADVLYESSLETLRLCECGLTGTGWKPLVSALNPSHLKNLDLSRNSFEGQTVTQLCRFLGNPDCQLERLWLFKTNLQKECAADLASALALNPQLKELDLGGNNLGDDGVTEIATLLKNPDCKMKRLRLAGCRFTNRACAELASSLWLNPAHLRVLDVARNDLRDDGVKNLSEFLADPLCQLETLNLKCCTLTAACCQHLTSALSCSSSSHLKDLDLSYNYLMDEGVRLLSDYLKTPGCRLEILRLVRCKFTDLGTAALASSLKSHPGHLRVLDVARNDFEGDGVKNLSKFVAERLRHLTLKLTDSTESSCKSSNSGLKLNPSHLRRLKLSDRGPPGLKLLPDLQRNNSEKQRTATSNV